MPPSRGSTAITGCSRRSLRRSSWSIPSSIPPPTTIRHAAAGSVNSGRGAYHRAVSTARRHHRLLSVSAFVLLLLAAEVGGRWLTFQVDGLLHVGDPMAASARYTPFLLLAVKVGSALLAA